jgi:hypothetical protein
MNFGSHAEQQWDLIPFSGCQGAPRSADYGKKSKMPLQLQGHF